MNDANPTAPKKLCIVGASAGVGLQCVQVALARGHEVVALARHPEAMPTHPRLERRTGSATDARDLRAAAAGADAVLVTLGTGRSTKPTTLYTDFARALLAIQAELGPTPVLLLTGFGAGDSARFQGRLTSVLFQFFLGAVYRDKTAMEQQITASGLNWMLVRPGVLTNGEPRGPTRVQTEYRRGMKVGFVSRRAVAEFMVAQAERPTMLKQAPAVG